jgi:4-carboxymuconolactone decarboxylase
MKGRSIAPRPHRTGCEERRSSWLSDFGGASAARHDPQQRKAAGDVNFYSFVIARAKANDPQPDQPIGVFSMRLPIIPPADLSTEQQPLYEDMRQGIAANFQGFVNIRDDGALLGPWNPWIHEPKFGKPVWELTKAMVSQPSLPATVREVAILVTGAHFRSAYELYAHVIVAERRGLSDEKLATIVAGQRPTDLTRQEAVAYDFASALVNGGVLPELTYKAAIEQFGQHGAAELSYLVGLYCLVSVTLNTFDVPVPE